jgi:hypothetical protein
MPISLAAIASDNTLTPAQKQAGFRLLFDGHSLTRSRDPAGEMPPGRRARPSVSYAQVWLARSRRASSVTAAPRRVPFGAAPAPSAVPQPGALPAVPRRRARVWRGRRAQFAVAGRRRTGRRRRLRGACLSAPRQPFRHARVRRTSRRVWPCLRERARGGRMRRCSWLATAGDCFGSAALGAARSRPDGRHTIIAKNDIVY